MGVEHETDFQDEVVCPHCGYRSEGSYEYFGFGQECTEIICDECGNEFFATQHVSVSYSTNPKAGRSD